jgi:hypothetical protein
VERLGDLDGEGIDELAWKDFSLLPNMYVSYGGRGVAAGASLVPDLDVAGDSLSVGRVTSADLDADGTDDLIVAARSVGSTQPEIRGGLYVVPGGSLRGVHQITLDARYLLVAGNDGLASGAFGSSLSASGDVTGDGIADVLAGTSTTVQGQPPNASQVLLIPGGLQRGDAER